MLFKFILGEYGMLAQGTLLIILASPGHFVWHVYNCFKKHVHAEPTSNTVDSTT